MIRYISLLVLFAVSVGNLQAKEMHGYLVGTIAGVTFDEPIICLGQNELPEAFFQDFRGYIRKSVQDGVKISGGANNKTMTLNIKGKGIDKHLYLRGVKKENGKIVYADTIKPKNKPHFDVDIKLWCSPDITHLKTKPTSTKSIKSTAAPYPVRDFDPVGKGIINTGSVEYQFDIAECNLQPLKKENGWTQQFYVVGAGKTKDTNFFVKFSYDKKGKKGLQKNILKFAPLPKELEFNLSTKEDMKAFEFINNADGINIFAGNKNSGRRLIVEGNKVMSESKVRLLYVTDGIIPEMYKKPIEATVLIQCD